MIQLQGIGRFEELEEFIAELNIELGLSEVISGLEAAELGLGVAEFREADFARRVNAIGGSQDKLVVDVAFEFLVLQADAEVVPLAWPIVRRGDFFEDLPLEDIRSIEAAEAEFSCAGVESVVKLAAIGMKGKTCGSLLGGEFHFDGDVARESCVG